MNFEVPRIFNMVKDPKKGQIDQEILFLFFDY